MKNKKEGTEEKSKFDLKKTKKVIITVFVTTIVIIFLFAIGQISFLTSIFGSLQSFVRGLTGVDPMIAKGIAALLVGFLTLLPLWAFTKSFTPIPQKNKKWYRAAVFALFAIGFFGAYLSSQGVFFNAETGGAIKYYSIHPDGTYQFYSGGGFDPITGDSLKEVTPDVIRKYLSGGSFDVAKPISGDPTGNINGLNNYVSYYTGSIVNNSGNTVFFCVAPNQGSNDLSDVYVVQNGRSIHINLLEGTHYFAVLFAGGFERKFKIDDPLFLADYEFWDGFRNRTSVYVSFNGMNYGIFSDRFFAMPVPPKNGWKLEIGEDNLNFTQVED